MPEFWYEVFKPAEARGVIDVVDRFETDQVFRSEWTHHSVQYEHD